MPVLGYATALSPGAERPISSTYSAITDVDEATASGAHHYSVRNQRLHKSGEDGQARPYRSSDFVLFSLLQAGSRNDEAQLPVYPAEVDHPGSGGAARPALLGRGQAQLQRAQTSHAQKPNLTRPDYAALRELFIGELTDRREEARLEGELGADELGEDERELDAGVARRIDELA